MKNIMKNIMKKPKTIKQVKKEINDKLDKNPLLIPAVSLAERFIKTYNDKDWIDYEKETGNPKVILSKNNKQQHLAFGLFLLWNITEFEKGFEEGYKSN